MELEHPALILDLGSGSQWWGPTVVSMDIHRFSHVNLVGGGQCLPFSDGTLDGVISTGVLEHVADADTVTREIWRILQPGGPTYVAVPFIEVYHPGTGTDQDFRRLTDIDLQQLLSAFERLDSGISGGPSASLAWILREYPALDRLLSRRDTAHRTACGFYLVGRKA